MNASIYMCPFLNPTGRFAMQAMKQMEPQVKQAIQSFPKTVRTSIVLSLISKVMHCRELIPECALQAFGSGYYRGGFDPKMNKREAALILGVRYVGIISQTRGLISVILLAVQPLTVLCFSPTANKNKIREAHRKLMVLNHPDRGTGSTTSHINTPTTVVQCLNGY